MKATYSTNTIALVLTTLLVASGCATKDIPVVEGYAPTVDIAGLVRDDSEAPTIIFRRPGAPELSEFRRFIIDPVEIYYDDPDLQELSAENVASLQQSFLEAMTRELTDAGFEVGTKSDAGTLRVSFALSGLQAPSAGPNVATLVFPYAIRVGEVTVEAVFRDSLTNQVEGVAITRARGSRWFNASPWSTWADVRKFFDGWAEGFRTSVEEAHAN